MCDYTYSQWIDRNNAIPEATLTASKATHRLSPMTQIMEAYHYSTIIPIEKLSITSGIPLALQLEQTSITK